jgi:SHS2 domain-containing protein
MCVLHDLSQQKKDEEHQNYASHLEELVEQRTKTLNDTIRALEKSKKSKRYFRERETQYLENRFFYQWLHMSSVLIVALSIPNRKICRTIRKYQYY